MSTTTALSTDPEKSHLLDQAIALAERSSGTGGPPKKDVTALLRAGDNTIRVMVLNAPIDVSLGGSNAAGLIVRLTLKGAGGPRYRTRPPHRRRRPRRLDPATARERAVRRG